MRILKLGSIAGLVLFFAVGCGPRLRDFDEVEAAFDAPSGTLDESTVGQLFGQSLRSSNAYGLSSVAGTFDQSGALKFALSSVDAALSTRREALVENCDVNVKIDRSGNVSKILVDCTAEGNDPRGKIAIFFDWGDGSDLVAATIHFQEWCDAGGDCLDGWMGLKTEVSGSVGDGVTERYLLVVNFDYQEGGATHHLEYAFRETFAGDTVEIELLVYVDEASFVLSAMASPEGGHLEIRAANGSFVCDYSIAGGDATSGTCTLTADGTTTITWSEG